MTRESRWKDISRRLLTVSIGAPLVLCVIYLGFPIYELIVASVALLSTFELYKMIAPGIKVNLLVSLMLVLLSLAGVVIGNFWPLLLVAVPTIAISSLGLLTVESRKRLLFSRALIYTALGALYIGLPLGFLLLIRRQEDGMWWSIVLFMNNWATDGFALIGGRIVGTRKLAPRISNTKTVEGALIGIAMGILIGLVTAYAGELNLQLAILVNMLIALLTLLGDLVESKIKRYFEVKDTGRFLPGHGGFLDRIDGLLLAAPVVFFVLNTFHLGSSFVFVG